jgi:hypothetical protein
MIKEVPLKRSALLQGWKGMILMASIMVLAPKTWFSSSKGHFMYVEGGFMSHYTLIEA